MKKILLLLIPLSTLCFTVPRHGEAVISTVGRASNSQPAYSDEFAYLDTQIQAMDISIRAAEVNAEIEKNRQAEEAARLERKRKRERVRSTSASAPATYVQTGNVWDRLAQCEAGGNWAANTGNGYYGGLQFSLSSWRGVGGTGYPHEASRETQIEMGTRLQASGGWGQWPACSRKLGLR